MIEGYIPFHWELEYPKVHFGKKGEKIENPGFDAIVGNPPWGADLPSTIEEYISHTYSLAKSANDTFAAFTKLSSGLGTVDSSIGFILPSGWQTSNKYDRFRKWVVTTLKIEKLANLPYDVFEDAYVDSSIFIFSSFRQKVTDLRLKETTAQIINYDRKENLNEIVPPQSDTSRVDYTRWFSNPLDYDNKYGFLSYLSSEELDVEEKVADVGSNLSVIADVQRGITPFNLTETNGENFAPGLDGELRRYRYSFNNNQYVEYHKDISEFKPERYFTGERLILRELISRQFRLQLILTTVDFVTNKSHQSILIKEEEYSAGYILAILNSKRLSFYHIRRSAVALRDDFPKIVLSETRSLPIPEIDFQSSQLHIPSNFDVSDVDIYSDKVLIATTDQNRKLRIEQSKGMHDLLAVLAEEIMSLESKRDELNPNLVDHFGSYSEESTLSGIALTQPPKSSTNSVLRQTAKNKPNLRIGEASIHRESPNTVLVKATARYKPDDEISHETDQWGYTETELLPAFLITDLTKMEADLIEHFVPVAVEEAGGFANFRETATKTNSLINRLKAIKLPDVDNVADDLERYLKTKERAEEIDEKIEKTDRLIDEIVYRLYGLTDEEIDIVEEAMVD